MHRVWISASAAAHPEYRVAQSEAAERIAAAVGDRRRVDALARGTKIDRRSVILPAEQVGLLGSIEDRNAVYQATAPNLARAAVGGLERPLDNVKILVTSSCTGYMVPGIDVELAQLLGLEPQTARLPITEAGCAGGVVALARAADYLRTRRACGLVVAVELCSLAFHADVESGNLTSALLFGDGAGAAYLQSYGPEPGALEIVDSASVLVPGTTKALGFALTNGGFYPQLTRDLVDLVPAPTLDAARRLLAEHELCLKDVVFWLVHPGGPKILEALERPLGLGQDDLRWSRDALREFGNTSSAAIFDVMSRYLKDAGSRRGWGIVVAFGPGVSVEMLLVHRD